MKLNAWFSSPATKLWRGQGLRIPAFGALVMAAGLLAGCGSSEPTFYGLATVPGTPQTNLLASMPQFRVIEVRNPTLPMRLDRDTIVLGSKDYKLNLALGATWNEPPSSLISGALLNDLQQRLPGSVIFPQDAAVTTPPQAYVDLSIDHFETLADGHAVISGVLSIRKAGILPQPACSRVVRWVSAQPVSNVTELVAALSTGMGVVADQTIADLRTLDSCPATGSSKPVSELQQAITQAVQATTAASSGN